MSFSSDKMYIINLISRLCKIWQWWRRKPNTFENTYFDYKIPKNIRKLITDDFLIEFRNQLVRINNLDLGEFADEIYRLTDTGGWYAAFGKACLLTNKSDLFKYWNELEWHDSDLFDDQLVDIMVERKFIINCSYGLLKELKGFNKDDDIVFCVDCGNRVLKDMAIKFRRTEVDELYLDEAKFLDYKCLYCNDKLQSEESNGSATDYYRSVLQELKELKGSEN